MMKEEKKKKKNKNEYILSGRNTSWVVMSGVCWLYENGFITRPRFPIKRQQLWKLMEHGF